MTGPESTTVITSDNPSFSIHNGSSKGDQSAHQLGEVILQEIATAPASIGGVGGYIAAALSESTRSAYRADLRDFIQWGGHVPCVSEVLASYIAERAATLSPYTITRRVVGISRAHVSQGFDDPAKCDLVRVVLRGVRRSHGKPQRQAAPLLKEDLMAILTLMSGTKGIRDRALLLVGFAAALRRSEIVGLDCTDISFVKEGMLVRLRRSKSDQEGAGRNIAVPHGRTSACPVKAVQGWLALAGIESGAVFRFVNKAGAVGASRLTAQSVNLIVKDYAKAIGHDPAAYSGHSLRAGLVTSAAQAGVAVHKIMAQTGHRSVEMVQRYIRDAAMFENNAAGLIL